MDAPIKTPWIKNIYLYLVSFVSLFMIVFSIAGMVNLALRTYIFTKADKNYYGYPEPACPEPAPTKTTDSQVKPTCISQEEREKNDAENRSAQRQRDMVQYVSMLIVGVPLFAYHWLIIRRKE